VVLGAQQRFSALFKPYSKGVAVMDLITILLYLAGGKVAIFDELVMVIPYDSRIRRDYCPLTQCTTLTLERELEDGTIVVVGKPQLLKTEEG
jgi:hypothetical protein